MEENVIFYDVNSLSELPKIEDENFRYLDFIGGTKEIRAFLIPISFPRKDFMIKYSNLIDNKLFAPIYDNKGILIATDTSFAVPGFYVLSYKDYINRCDNISDNLMMRTGILIKNLRKGMKEILNFECCALFSEEKKNGATPLHYWILPKYAELLEKGIDQKFWTEDINKYLRSFKYSEYRDKMIECNEKMRQYFEDIDLKTKDNEIFNMTEKLK